MWLLLLFAAVCAAIHPIEVNGRHFYDSVTSKPFFIRGVDYQPGGSSGVDGKSDPLSDPDKCARDIYLFQQLGVNTVRVYSINPDLDHDKCMSMLAIAGIYLVLDVNSPLQGQHLNRYEPWSTYNRDYLSHVFKVVTEFSGYNNTLGFFGGNEVVNDKRSAANSPTYVKGLIRDMKEFMASSAYMRKVPVGYSAADDLDYRISLAKYLECYEASEYDQIDFYGVNTYQWCGHQTFTTSGYDRLVRDYEDFTKPIFFSEYGCNEVLPRRFEEVEAIYSTRMSDVFSGGMIYEFAQEPNNYGLVDYDSDGNAKLLPDFYAFQKRLKQVKQDPPVRERNNRGSLLAQSTEQPFTYKMCQNEYDNLDISKGLPKTVGKPLERSFSVQGQGELKAVSENDRRSTYKVYDVDGSLITDHPFVKEVNQLDSSLKKHQIWSNGKQNRTS